MPATNKNNKSIFRFLYYLLLIINGIVIISLFFSIWSWWIPPEKTTLFAYAGLVFPFILAANIAFVILWTILFKWKYALISFLPLLICISPIKTYFPVHSKTEEIPEDCIKVLSYNVRAFNWFREKDTEKNSILEYIRESDADIVCLQEFLALEDRAYASSQNIQKTLKNYPYFSFIAMETGIKRSRKSYRYGLACFSKYPIEETTQIPIESRNIAGSVLYKIKINGKTISVINNHLESNALTSEDKKLYQKFFADANRQTLDDVAHNIRLRLGSAFRKRSPQADMVDEVIKKQETDGIIVCGDFNDTPISYTYHKIKGDLKDSFAETGFGAGITYHENHFWFRIDYIMHSKNMKAYNCTVDKVKYSDHYPIWTYLKIE